MSNDISAVYKVDKNLRKKNIFMGAAILFVYKNKTNKMAAPMKIFFFSIFYQLYKLLKYE